MVIKTAEESHDELVTLLIYQVLKVLLEKIKSTDLQADLKHKITRKLGVCEKLIMFFDENKKTNALRSFEYISTGIMISAKIFENEENVRTFAKHSQFCDTSTKKLKSIELEFLERSNWDVDHESLIDVGLHFISNFLFRPNDLLKSSDQSACQSKLPADFHAHLSLENIAFLESICALKFQDFLSSENTSTASSWQKEDLRKISKTIFEDFRVIFREILKKFILKSSLKTVLVLWAALLVKEAHCGNEFWIRYKLKMNLVQTLQR